MPDQPLDPANVAQLVSVALRLAMEVSVLRERLATHEVLLSRRGILNAEAVDTYEPTAEELQARLGASRELIEAVARDIGPKDPSAAG